MEKDSIATENKSVQNKLFPHLRKSYSATKNFIALSKVEIDRNLMSIDHSNSKMSSREANMSQKKFTIGPLSSQKHISSQLPKQPPKKSYQLFADKNRSYGLGQQKSTSIGHLAPTLKQQPQKVQNLPLIDKSKISSKPIGCIKGYSINSHPGPHNISNEDRICVVTNLSKTSGKDQLISFFSIYDGCNGVGKAQFFRDNFHSTLIRDKEFHKDIQASIKKALIIVQDNFSRANIDCQVSPTTSVLLAVVLCTFVKHVENCVYIASVGDNKVIISSNFGKEVKNPLVERQTRRKSKSLTKYPQRENKWISIDLIKLSTEQLDFIVLGSEGLFQNFSEKYIGVQLWKHYLEKMTDNFHVSLGEATNVMMNEIFQEMSTKNVSLILISFQNMVQCFEPPTQLNIPFLEVSSLTTIQQF